MALGRSGLSTARSLEVGVVFCVLLAVLAVVRLPSAEAEDARPELKTRLVLPRSTSPAQKTGGTVQGSPAPLPAAENIPGSIPNILKRLDELSTRLDQLSTRLTSLEQHQQSLRSDYTAFKEKARGPYCETAQRSVNPMTGAAETCAAYACNEVTGLCRTSCSVTAQCAPQHVCDRDLGQGQCIRAR